MPRPKVHPSQRRRAAEACNFCRTSKKRCSATVPCTACQRRGISASCYLTNRPRGLRTVRPLSSDSGPGLGASSPNSGCNDLAGTEADASSEREQSHQNASARDGDTCHPMPTDNWHVNISQDSRMRDGQGRYQSISLSEPSTGGNETASNRIGQEPGTKSTLETSPIGPESHARMLLNLRGERVYIGGAASLSFLQVIRDTVAAQIGPSQFSHNDTSDSMLETESAVILSNSEASSCMLEVETSLLYATTFQAATGGFLDVFTLSEIEELILKLHTEEAISMPACQKASVDLVVAIGAQCKSPADAQQIGQMYFRQAQRTAFSSMLEDPNTDMVRAFLLMAFYMLGDCRRNTAFMYLGISARAAVALGMHSRESYTDMKSPLYQSRLRIWMSLCILDMVVCSILGRPPATSGLRSELDNGLIDFSRNFPTQGHENTSCLFASYKILSIINESVDAFYGKKVASTTLVEQFLSKIEDWSQQLPDFLRNPPTASMTSPPQRTTMGSIHVSCLYYFAVTLVTRPVLISRLTSRPGTATPTSSPLASACLDAAVYLVQTCADAHKARLLLGNMCIMKALVFAAGLIIGFDMFAKKELDYEVETAFRGARDVLDFLATQSPQAAHYSEILNLLSNAIMKQRSKLSVRNRSKFVGKIFSLNGETATAQDISTDVGNFLPQTQVTNNAGLGSGDPDAIWFVGDPPNESGEMEGDLLRGWDSLDLSQWDSFPFYSPRVFGAE